MPHTLVFFRLLGEVELEFHLWKFALKSIILCGIFGLKTDCNLSVLSVFKFKF